MKQEDEEASRWVTRSWEGQYDWKDIAQWNRVTAIKMQQAKMLLQSAPSVRITYEQAHDLTGESGFDEGEGSPYLVRAVADANGIFPVEPSVRPSGDVWVGGGANSKCSVAKQRQAVVLWLEKVPERIYVTFYVNPD